MVPRGQQTIQPGSHGVSSSLVSVGRELG